MRNRFVALAITVAVVVTATVALAGCPPASSGEGEGEGEGEGAGEGEGEGASVDEVEPNDGATTDQVNALAAGDEVHGAIQSPGDVDIFHVDTVAGDVYRVTLTAPAGSTIDGHVTVLDAGDGTHAAGNDYVRLERAPDGPNAALSFVAFGSNGHLVAVRDARDVDGTPTGDDGATYVLTVVDEGPAAGDALAFPSTVQDALDDVGGVKLYSFTGTENADVTIDLAATGDLDARLFVYSADQRDWILRDDDRAADDKDPLIDAFFPVGGPMVLVVESAGESAADLGYTITTTGN